MTRQGSTWRMGGALVALLGLVTTGCRPLLAPPPGCEEAGVEACEPAPPESAAEVRLVAPAGLVGSAAAPPLFGRFLPLELEVSRLGAISEVEVLCGDRRLATWWPAGATDDALTLKALIDLLPCRPPGTHAHPLPVTLSVVAEDELGARHDHGQFALLADFTVEEGELDAPGHPDADAVAHLEVSDAAPTPEGLPALLRVEGALAQPPEIRIGAQVLVVHPVREGWRFFVPAPAFGSGDIDTFEQIVELQIRLKTPFGVTTLLREQVTFSRAVRTVHLQGNLFSPDIPKPAGLPVMTDAGWVMILDDTSGAAADPAARWARVPADPDGALPQLTFARDAAGGGGSCSVPGPPTSGAVNTCILGMTGRGQLVVRHPRPTPLSFLVSVSAPDAFEDWTPDARLDALLQPAMVDPAPFSQPQAWGRLGADRLCSEARTTSCVGLPCGPFHRACVLGSGAGEFMPPEAPTHTSWDAGHASRARGGGPYFATFDHVSTVYGNLPVVTLGTETSNQRPLGIGTTGFWNYERNGAALVPVRDGFALLSLDWANTFYPGPEIASELTYSLSWNDGRYLFHAIVHVEPDGALIVLGEDANGVQHLSRWRPGSTTPERVQALPAHPTGYEGTPQPSLDLLEDGYSQTFPDGSAALVYRVGHSGLPYRLLVVDAELRPLLRRRSAHPMRAEVGPAGDTLWIIEAAGDGNRILILPR